MAVRGIPEQVTALPALHLRPEAAPGRFTVNQFLVDSDEVLHLGGAALARRVTEIATPHVPHNWESHMFFEQETGTLFCCDLLTQLGDGPPVTGEDILDAAIAAEETFHQTSLGPATYRRLADLGPCQLAIMHGSTYAGDCPAVLRAMAEVYERQFGCGAPSIPAQPLSGHDATAGARP